MPRHRAAHPACRRSLLSRSQAAHPRRFVALPARRRAVAPRPLASTNTVSSTATAPGSTRTPRTHPRKKLHRPTRATRRLASFPPAPPRAVHSRPVPLGDACARYSRRPSEEKRVSLSSSPAFSLPGAAATSRPVAARSRQALAGATPSWLRQPPPSLLSPEWRERAERSACGPPVEGRRPRPSARQPPAHLWCPRGSVAPPSFPRMARDSVGLLAPRWTTASPPVHLGTAALLTRGDASSPARRPPSLSSAWKRRMRRRRWLTLLRVVDCNTKLHKGIAKASATYLIERLFDNEFIKGKIAWKQLLWICYICSSQKWTVVEKFQPSSKSSSNINGPWAKAQIFNEHSSDDSKRPGNQRSSAIIMNLICVGSLSVI